jgi:hypothetical protein
MKVLKFCKMMTARGHTVYHYGHKDSQVECTEHVPVTFNEDMEIMIGRRTFFSITLAIMHIRFLMSVRL